MSLVIGGRTSTTNYQSYFKDKNIVKEAMKIALSDEPDDQVKHTIEMMKVFSKMTMRRIKRIFKALLSEYKDEGSLSWTIFWIGQLQIAELLPEIIEIARNSKSAMNRKSSTITLKNIPSKDSTSTLLYMLKKDEDSEVRALSAEALGNFNSPQVVLELIQIIEGKEQLIVKQNAVWSLDEIAERNGFINSKTLIRKIRQKKHKQK